MAGRRYKVILERGDENGQWVASIAEVLGCHTFGRGLAQTRRRIREALALQVGKRAADQATLDEVLPLPVPLREELAAIARSQAEVDRLAAVQQDLTERRRALARRLVARRGWSLRDVAGVLGLSFQRVDQLVNGSTE
jgi:predicted RNase H-like HicB family nuclease